MKGAAAVDLAMGRGDVREQERSGLGLEFGLESTPPYDRHPRRFIWTVGSSAAAVVNTTTSVAGAAAGAQLPPLYPTSGADNGGTRGPIFYHNGGDGGGGGGIYDSYDAAARARQPFPSSFKSQVEAAGMGSPVAPRCTAFTPAQWQELNRQALIYKHFVSSAPVPSDLVFDPRALPSITHLYPNPRGGGAGYFNLRFTNNTDPEPGRCRRTDGKKWRCSREVAPDHKYCERHMHRGRPRSRKPVEQHQKTAAAAAAASATGDLVGVTGGTTTPATSSAASSSAPVGTEAVGGVPPKPYGQTPAAVTLPFLSTTIEKEPRYCLDWMKGGLEEIHSRGKNRVGPATLHQYEGDFKLNHSDLNDPCNSFLDPDLASLDPDQRCPPRRFIDAWSKEKPPVSSALTLSMSGSGMGDADRIQMGLGINESAGRSREESQHLSWMNPVTTLGGPLAEALGSHNCNGEGEGRMSGVGRSYAAPVDRHLTGRSCCRTERARSPRDSPLSIGTSPTGVLQRTFVSLSDSSSSSSPTFATGGGRSEMGHLQWPGQPL